MRTVTEGTWSGYQPWQSRVCHRTIHKGKSPFQDIHTVAYTDGTTLILTHREAKPREKIEVIDGYSEMLWKFVAKGMTGYCRVDDLHSKPILQVLTPA